MFLSFYQIAVFLKTDKNETIYIIFETEALNF